MPTLHRPVLLAAVVTALGAAALWRWAWRANWDYTTPDLDARRSLLAHYEAEALAEGATFADHAEPSLATFLRADG